MKSRAVPRPFHVSHSDELLRRTLEVMRSGSDQGAVGGDGPSRSAKPAQSEHRLRNKPSLIPEGVRPLVIDRVAHRRLDDLILYDEIRDEVTDFLNEYANAALLRSNSLEPRHKLLLIGPPGNGKTSLAEAIAFQAGLPFFTVRYDALIDSLLGETASRLRRLMDFAANCPCLLFFDEFDSVGKERGDTQDVGEVKRVVGSLLVQLDDLPSHTVVVCATNHPELLDRAVWRRFDLRLAIESPGIELMVEWFNRLKTSLNASSDVETIARQFVGQSFSEIEKFTLDVRRKLVLSQGNLTSDQALQDAIVRWSRRLGQNRVVSGNAGTSDNKAAKGAPRPPRKKSQGATPIPTGLLV